MSPSLLPQSWWALRERLRRPLNCDPQEASRLGAPGSERILLDILEHDWREAQDSRQELCQKLDAVQGELQWAEELRDKVVLPSCPPPPPCLVSALSPRSSLLTAWLPGRGGGWVSALGCSPPSLSVRCVPGTWAKKRAFVCS